MLLAVSHPFIAGLTQRNLCDLGFAVRFVTTVAEVDAAVGHGGDPSVRGLILDAALGDDWLAAAGAFNRRPGLEGRVVVLTTETLRSRAGRRWGALDLPILPLPVGRGDLEAQFLMDDIPAMTPERNDPQPAPAGRGRGLQILLVEDNAVNQRLAVRFLERLEHAVTVADNGRDGLRAWREGRFDLVFMDIQMPILDGLDTTRIIRREENGAMHTPIVAMTAHALSGDRERCLAAGMDDYIAKPIRGRQLQRLLADLRERGLLAVAAD